jgi:hypothetical protein
LLALDPVKAADPLLALDPVKAADPLLALGQVKAADPLPAMRDVVKVEQTPEPRVALKVEQTPEPRVAVKAEPTAEPRVAVKVEPTPEPRVALKVAKPAPLRMLVQLVSGPLGGAAARTTTPIAQLSALVRSAIAWTRPVILVSVPALPARRIRGSCANTSRWALRARPVPPVPEVPQARRTPEALAPRMRAPLEPRMPVRRVPS